MTSKDYVAIAKVIRAEVDKVEKELSPVPRAIVNLTLLNVVEGLGAEFAATNSRFDYPRFLIACGFGE